MVLEIPLDEWQPLLGWCLMFMSRGGADVFISRIRVESAALSMHVSVNTSVHIEPLFVSAAAAFEYYAPPIIEEASVLPLSGPIRGSTLVQAQFFEYRQSP